MAVPALEMQTLARRHYVGAGAAANRPCDREAVQIGQGCQGRRNGPSSRQAPSTFGVWASQLVF